MFYKKELDFFTQVIERSKIKTTIVTKKELPLTVDMGIREFLHLKKDYEELFNINTEPNVVYKIVDPFFCNYIFIPLPDAQDNPVLIVGPYTKNIVTKESISKKSLEYGFSKDVEKQIQNYFSIVPYLYDDGMVMTLVNCLCENLYGALENFKIKVQTISQLSDSSFYNKNTTNDKNDDPLMTIQMLERRYKAENSLMDAVSQGLLHKAEMLFTNIKPSASLETRIPDPLRNAKNFMIILNTLLRKAAEQGSVHILYIDSVSSDFAHKIEALENMDEIDDLFYYMIKKYCRLVNKHSQKNYSLLIQKAILHIDADITADLSLKNLANTLGVTPSYLSSLFKKETGMPLTEYVNKHRTERAKQLLLSSNLQVQQIAQNCGILDVNYFTKIFKRYTGKTPNEFRKQK
ncbi:MAG: helix-turn-helix domain-containing protein [Clostridia bacterium]|nr:helix-turn-helix domain-containing protein [Clostridia bacterium]